MERIISFLYYIIFIVLVYLFIYLGMKEKQENFISLIFKMSKKEKTKH